MELKELKLKYNLLSKKYSLPDFKEINENFEIERITEDTDILLKNVKKLMIEKIINLTGFMEMLLNPMNAPRMYLSYLQGINGEDRKSIEKIYGILADLNLMALECEIDYSEEREAGLIKNIFKTWNELKPEFKKLFDGMKKPNGVKQKERTYFG